MPRAARPRVTEYHALSYVLDETGHLSLHHLQMDPSTRRLITVCLGHEQISETLPPFPSEILEEALRRYREILRDEERGGQPAAEGPFQQMLPLDWPRNP